MWGVNTHDPAKRVASREALEALARSLEMEYVEVDDTVPGKGVKEMFQEFLTKAFEYRSPCDNTNEWKN